MIVVSAGRRPDAAGSPARFPPHNVPGVRERIRRKLVELRPSMIVAGAACGTDLLVLDVAGDLGIARTVVLSSSKAEFRKTSVADRPGGWELLYDRIIAEVGASSALRELKLTGESAYLAANEAMIEVAEGLGRPITGLIVWDEKEREGGDVTAHFLGIVRKRGHDVAVVSTRIEQ